MAKVFISLSGKTDFITVGLKEREVERYEEHGFVPRPAGMNDILALGNRKITSDVLNVARVRKYAAVALYDAKDKIIDYKEL